jgi:hypothetical protein
MLMAERSVGSVSLTRRGNAIPGPLEIDAATRKFLRLFPQGFQDETYLDWERNYKWEAHKEWKELLGPAALKSLIRRGKFQEAARHAIGIESGRSFLFSFEKMAIRDAVKTPAAAEYFVRGLNAWLYGTESHASRFAAWCEVIESLPRRQTRVSSWPVVTVFGFIAHPTREMFVKPNTIRAAAQALGFAIPYASRPNWGTYASVLRLAQHSQKALAGLKPRDWIDIQSFLWVQGSDEYG